MMAAPALVYHDPFSFSPELVAFIPVLSPENSVEVTTSITGWRSLWDRHNKSILFFVYPDADPLASCRASANITVIR
jgi:hypothetical protein